MSFGRNNSSRITYNIIKLDELNKIFNIKITGEYDDRDFRTY